MNGIEKNEKPMSCRSSGVLEIIFYVKILENEFSWGRPGPTGSETTIIRSVKLRHIFFIFDLSGESWGKREISEKLENFAKMCVSKVRFFTLRCALLELVLKSSIFSEKLRTFFNKRRIGGYHKTDV